MKLFRRNKLWEGSRFMMPEHIKELRELERKKREYHPQALDEQHLEQLSYLIDEAIQCKKPIVISYTDKYGVEQFCGYVSKLDTQIIKLENGSHSKTIEVSRIRDVENPSDLEK